MGNAAVTSNGQELQEFQIALSGRLQQQKFADETCKEQHSSPPADQSNQQGCRQPRRRLPVRLASISRWLPQMSAAEDSSLQRPRQARPSDRRNQFPDRLPPDWPLSSRRLQPRPGPRVLWEVAPNLTNKKCAPIRKGKRSACRD